MSSKKLLSAEIQKMLVKVPSIKRVAKINRDVRSPKFPKKSDVKQRLVEENMGLVYAAAKRFIGRGAEFEDIVQCGGIGLIKAANNFNKSLGVKFSTYALNVIFGEIKTYFRENFSLKVSRKTKDLYLKIRSETEKFINLNGRYPTICELAKSLDINENDVLDALECGKGPISLTSFANNEDTDSAKSSAIADIPIENFDKDIENKVSIEAILETFKKFDKALIKLRFYMSKTQSETAKALGVTQATISKREKFLLGLLRKKLS